MAYGGKQIIISFGSQGNTRLYLVHVRPKQGHLLLASDLIWAWQLVHKWHLKVVTYELIYVYTHVVLNDLSDLDMLKKSNVIITYPNMSSSLDIRPYHIIFRSYHGHITVISLQYHHITTCHPTCLWNVLTSRKRDSQAKEKVHIRDKLQRGVDELVKMH